MSKFTAFNPATNKIQGSGRLDIKEASSLVAGNAVKKREEAKRTIESCESLLRSRLSELRRLRRNLVTNKKSFKSMMRVDPIIQSFKAMKSSLKKSDAFKRGLIEDFRAVSPFIFITTSEIKFHKGTVIHDGRSKITVKEDISIGRFLIKINPTSSLRSDIEAVNMMWRVKENINRTTEFSHPFIKFTEICWGQAATEASKLLVACNVIGLVDLIMDLLLSVHTTGGYMGWKKFIREKKPLSKCIYTGLPWVRWRDGTTSEPMKNGVSKEMTIDTMLDIMRSFGNSAAYFQKLDQRRWSREDKRLMVHAFVALCRSDRRAVGITITEARIERLLYSLRRRRRGQATSVPSVSGTSVSTDTASLFQP